MDPPGEAFTITSPDVMLQPSQEVTYCYYFHTPNTSALAINKWVSDMTPGSHHMIFFAGGNHADGLDTTNSCGFGGSISGSAQSQWVFASQTPHGEEDLPADDGTGKPLAQNIAANTAGAFQMHYLNTTDNVLTVHVQLKAYALPAGTTYTQTDAYVTYNNSINIPPNAVNHVESASCPAPSGKFWQLSTHAHKQMVGAEVKDGTSVIDTTTDWEHPTVTVWNATPFYTFSSGSVSWDCTYDNTGSNAANTVVSGTSAQTNEMCMATGYYFPSTGAKGCLYDTQLIPSGDHCYCQ
jgi:hypothetical protein